MSAQHISEFGPDYRRKQSDEVYYSTEAFPIVDQSRVEFLKKEAKRLPRRRCRLCLHPSADDSLHEMVIVFHETAYFRPLRHAERPQSFQILEGRMRLALLDDRGEVRRVVELGDRSGSLPFGVRIPSRNWYAFVMLSEWLVFLETTTKPSRTDEREYAPFAPEESDPAAVGYSNALRARVLEFPLAGRA
jgi:cupin fold WbuC family metalloprotein